MERNNSDTPHLSQRWDACARLCAQRGKKRKRCYGTLQGRGPDNRSTEARTYARTAGAARMGHVTER